MLFLPFYLVFPVHLCFSEPVVSVYNDDFPPGELVHVPNTSQNFLHPHSPRLPSLFPPLVSFPLAKGLCKEVPLE